MESILYKNNIIESRVSLASMPSYSVKRNHNKGVGKISHTFCEIATDKVLL